MTVSERQIVSFYMYVYVFFFLQLSLIICYFKFIFIVLVEYDFLGLVYLLKFYFCLVKKIKGVFSLFRVIHY